LFIELFAEANFSEIFTREAIFVVISLVLIEGLLSVDNALAIAALASHLEPKQRKIAMTIGYAGAYGFRLIALSIASYIINNHWLMIAGASYLIWLMCDHFDEDEEHYEHPGEPSRHTHTFGRTIAMIAFLDLSLSLDNVVAAIAFARDNIWFVYLGVTIGIITLWLVAGYCIKLLAKHPWLEHTAFILVGFVGALLCFELYWDQMVKRDVDFLGISIIHGEDGHYHIQKIAKFGGILTIMFGHLIYEKVPGVKPIFRPLFAVLEYFFAIIARIVAFIFGIITYPIRLIYRMLRPAPVA
jgi:YkoY family integral membrane protein